MTGIRPPAVAGSFYPDEPAILEAVVADFLAEACGMPGRQSPKAIIAPHAGYIYSGPVAAQAYAALAPAAGDITRVVLIGPAHFVWVSGIAAPGVEAFESPLGRVPLDRPAIAGIADLPQVVITDTPHGDEHSLEVQLPFLQTVLGDFALVPLAVGNAEPAEVAQVLERLWGGAETLIVVSSDLSHYHTYEAAKRRDAETAAAIESLDGGRLGPEDACGCLPICGLLATAARRGLSVERLDLRSSGDTAGPKDRVVGYGAWAFHESTG
ncbi:MAG: AmmeMemoRadiSam system protein B [Kiloniellaceae bacterium]